MHIEHIAVLTNHLEQMRAFYETYFQARAGNKYRNPTKQFESYFLNFSSGARLELMSRPGIHELKDETDGQFLDCIHISFACGSEESVDELTDHLQKDGYRVMDGPRHTGDGYYESAVLDPDGNWIEITV
ncbi:MAG: VOC family protein [Anaerolineales bacterium]